MFTDEQVEAAVRALSDPERFAGAERRVSAIAPQLQHILAHALNEGGWFGEAHESQLRQALAEPDPAEQADPRADAARRGDPDGHADRRGGGLGARP